MTNAEQFAMPDVGEGLTEAEIVGWRVEPGDTVTINQIIVEVETAKAVVELPSPFAGIVRTLHHPAGTVVPVGEVIITIGDEETAPAARPDSSPAPATLTAPTADQVHQPTADNAAARPEVLVGYGPSHQAAVRRPRRLSAVGVVVPSGPRPNHGYATPPIRKLARSLGVDIGALVGSGKHGEVVRADVMRAAGDPKASSPPKAAILRTPIKGVRRHTADAMIKSAFTAPHVTEWVSVDVTRTLALVDRLRADRAYSEVRITPLLLVVRAALLAIARNPAINAKWDGATNEILQYPDVNLGIAAATPRGLIVPNIAAAQSLSLTDLAAALGTLIADARAGKTQPRELSGGTFTITNIGVFGVDGGTPILNPGEAAILCFGQIRRQPWNHKGRVVLREVSTLAMSFDHRLVDGELGSRVLADIAALLERPELAFAW